MEKIIPITSKRQTIALARSASKSGSFPEPVRTSGEACPICKGAGWLRVDCAWGDPRFGKPVRCTCRTSSAPRDTNRTYRWLGQGDDYALAMENMAFAGFQQRFPYEGHIIDHSSNYQECLGYAALVKSQPKGQRNLLLIGSYGVGKTRLAAAILNECRAANIACLCATVPDLFKAIYAGNFEEKEEIIQQASTTRVLLLDDLDKLHIRSAMPGEKPGTYQKEKLFEILNSRYVGKLPTIVTTNAEEDMSLWLGEAGISRFFSNVTALKMIGPDYRMI